jgi:hypothetical protein
MFRVPGLSLLLCAAPFLAAATPPVAASPAAAKGRAVMARLPLRFEANQGQLPAQVRYAARAGGYSLLLADSGPAVVLDGRNRIDIRLLNASRATLEPLEPLATRTDYFVGDRRNWHTSVPSFGRVRYRSVYPGVDAVYYGNESQLEYDFMVAPGADASAIRLEFAGAERLSLNASGDLDIEANGSRMIQRRPFLYQANAQGERSQVPGEYVLLGGNLVAFQVGSYDRKRELVIDPVLTYANYFGGDGIDKITAAKMGPNGKLYLVGWTDSGQQPFKEDAFRQEFTGVVDIFIAIVDTNDPGYHVLYFSYFGGSNTDAASAIDIDPAGVLYLTGTTNSTNFPTVNPSQSSGSTSGLDAFVVKLDPSISGSDALLFSTYLSGTTGDDSGNGIAVDADGMIYVIGTTQSDDLAVTNSAYQPVKWGGQDAFLAKIDPVTPSVLYLTYFGGEDLDDGRAIAIGRDGRAYFAASTLSQTPPWEGPVFSGSPFGAEDMVLGILDASKEGTESVPYATIFGGSGNDEIRGMTLAQDGSLILTGYTLSTDFPTTPDALQGSNNGRGDAFLTIFDPRKPYASGLVYSTYLGGKGGDVGYGAADDAAGSLYITGYTLSSDFPIAGPVPQPTYPGGTDLFVTKLKRGVAGRGAIQWSTYLGATATYVPSGLTVGANGTVYVTGYGYIGLPTSEISTQGGHGGGQWDGFLVVLQQEGTQSPSQLLSTPNNRRMSPGEIPGKPGISDLDFSNRR